MISLKNNPSKVVVFHFAHTISQVIT